MTDEPIKRRQPKESVADDLQREGLPPCKYFLSTGSTLLDLAISDRCPGGVASGRITHFYGGNSTAKSVLVQEICASAQAVGGSAVYGDAEHTLDLSRARSVHGVAVGGWEDEETRLAAMGLPWKDPKLLAVQHNFVYRSPTLLEDWWDVDVAAICGLVKKGKLASPCAHAIDSISALPSKVETAGSLADSGYGQSRPKVNSQAFRVYLHPIAEADLTIVAVDQTRDAVGKMSFGPPKPAVSGGHAIEFYASTRVQLDHAGYILNRYKKVVGVRVRFDVTKNKVAPPHRGGTFVVLFDYGIDDVTSCLEWLRDTLYPKKRGEKSPDDGDEQGVAEALGSKLRVAGGGYWKWGDATMGQGIASAVRFVENEEGGYDELRGEVARVWRELYRGDERRPRRR